MRNRKRWIIIVCATSVPAAGIAGALIGGRIGGVVGVLVGTLGSGVFAPVRDYIKTLIERFATPQCRIVLFAHPGAGKTELRKRLLGRDEFVFGQVATKDPDVLTEDFEVGEKYRKQKVRVSINDYSGQKPSQVVGDYDGSFFWWT